MSAALPVNVRWVVCATALIAATVVALPGSAAARPLPPGGGNDSLTDPLVGVTLAERPELAGDVIFDLTQPFADPAQFFEGELRTVIVREAVSGTLDFYYSVEPAYDSYSVRGFDSRQIDVETRLDFPDAPGGPGGGVARSADGDQVNFSFRGGRFTFLQTDATEFDQHGSAVFVPDSSGSPVTISGVAVPSAIPLPPAAYAGVTGLVMAVGYCRRLRRRQTAK